MKRVALPHDILWFLTMSILAEGFQTSPLAMRCKCEIPSQCWTRFTLAEALSPPKEKSQAN